MDPWNSHIIGSRSSVRCGNCGGQNHTSQECMTGCRYCGDPGHLSEICSSSINGTNLEILSVTSGIVLQNLRKFA
ncbi:hypothetical protein C2G38_2092462 [Gigaspora rosea]|uniref:CCHC-type domain-containing protein n=1 Tax=Gigaspora rosea TaxID=44941 RepID=A0A397V1L5_9GLOM|nr:hypothetical protein C2G38_2092462 [Gigaspora rosea]